MCSISLITEDNIDDVVSIHLRSWIPQEWSVKLGRRYIHSFYREIARSNLSQGFLASREGHIVGYVTVITDYEKFNKEFLRRNFTVIFLSVLSSLLCGRLSFADVVDITKDSEKLKLVLCPKSHLGALALAPDYKRTQIGSDAINLLLNTAHTYLRNQRAKYVWGACDVQNKPMQFLFLMHKYVFRGKIAYRRREIWVFEKKLC